MTPLTRLTAEASRAVLNGFTLEVDVKVWRHPQRFMDEKRGRATWDKIMRYLERAEGSRNRNGLGRQSCANCTGKVAETRPPYLSPYVSFI